VSLDMGEHALSAIAAATARGPSRYSFLRDILSS
jgi:hypothetical protein